MRWKNALKIGAYNKNGELVATGRVASGLTDKLRQELGENPTKYIGMVVEVSCMALDKKNHTLRHPVFEQFRPDKNAEDCILEEIFGK
jgi:ATP-dependent DNA ligase